jgi:hypothetical protein
VTYENFNCCAKEFFNEHLEWKFLKLPLVTTSMKKLIIIKAGSTFPALRQRLGDFEDWIIHEIGSPNPAITLVHAMEGEVLPPVDILQALS